MIRAVLHGLWFSTSFHLFHWALHPRGWQHITISNLEKITYLLMAQNSKFEFKKPYNTVYYKKRQISIFLGNVNYPLKKLTIKKFNKVYRTVQELGIQEFTEQSSTKFIEFIIINIELSIIIPECSALYIEKFYKFCRTLFRKCLLYPQILNSSINFTKLFFSVWRYFKKILRLFCIMFDPRVKSRKKFWKYLG